MHLVGQGIPQQVESDVFLTWASNCLWSPLGWQTISHNASLSSSCHELPADGLKVTQHAHYLCSNNTGFHKMTSTQTSLYSTVKDIFVIKISKNWNTSILETWNIVQDNYVPVPCPMYQISQPENILFDSSSPFTNASALCSRKVDSSLIPCL